MNNMKYDGYGYPDFNMVNDYLMNVNVNSTMNSNYANNANTNTDLANANEGYIRGNLFNSLYTPYKNYKPSALRPTNEQAALLLDVNQNSFAAHELRLYLDVNPNDTNMISLFNNYQRMTNEAIRKYEAKYGPILSSSMSEGNVFSWEAYSWPWEKEEM